MDAEHADPDVPGDHVTHGVLTAVCRAAADEFREADVRLVEVAPVVAPEFQHVVDHAAGQVAGVTSPVAVRVFLPGVCPPAGHTSQASPTPSPSISA